MASSGDHDESVAADNKIRRTPPTHTELVQVGGGGNSDDGGGNSDLRKHHRFRIQKSHHTVTLGKSHDENRSQNAAAPLFAPKRRALTSTTLISTGQIEDKSKRKKGEGDHEQGEGKGKKKNAARHEGPYGAPTQRLKDERFAVGQDPPTHTGSSSQSRDPSTNIGSTHPHVFHKDPFVESPSTSSDPESHVPHTSSRHDDDDGSNGTSNVHSHLSEAPSFLSGVTTEKRKASSSKQLPKAFMQLEQKGLFQGVIKGEQSDQSRDRSSRKLLYGLPKLVWVILADVLAMTVFLTCIPVVLSCAKRRRPLFR